jgi:hypothetical protein
VRGEDPDRKGLIMRRSRQVLVAACGLTVAAATAVPVFAQGGSPAAAVQPASTRHVVKLQANNLYFCKYSAPGCDSSDTNFRTRIVIGTTVKWFYKDPTCDSYAFCPGHTVHVKGHKDSATVKQDGALIKSMTFRSVGRFSYMCTHHGNTGMTGRIIVRRS